MSSVLGGAVKEIVEKAEKKLGRKLEDAVREAIGISIKNGTPEDVVLNSVLANSKGGVTAAKAGLSNAVDASLVRVPKPDLAVPSKSTDLVPPDTARSLEPTSVAAKYNSPNALPSGQGPLRAVNAEPPKLLPPPGEIPSANGETVPPLAAAIDGKSKLPLGKIGTLGALGTAASLALPGDSSKETTPPTPAAGEATTPAPDSTKKAETGTPATPGAAPSPELSEAAKKEKVPLVLAKAGWVSPDAGVAPEPAKLTTPAEFGQAVDAAKEVLAALPQEAALDTNAQNATAKLTKALSDLKTEYDENKTRAGWGQIAEVFGNALAKIGAARYGLKHGVDMSGTKFSYNDWDKTYDRLTVERRLALEEARNAYGADADVIAVQRKSLEAARDRLDRRIADKAGADQDTNKTNLTQAAAWGAQDAARRMNILEGNASRQTQASTTNANIRNDEARRIEAQNARDAEAVKKDAEAAAKEKKEALSLEEKQRYDRSLDRWKMDLANYSKAKGEYEEGKLELIQAASLPNGAAKKLSIQRALTKIAPFTSPDVLNKFQITKEKDKGYNWVPFSGSDDAVPGLVAALSSDQTPTPRIPAWNDYKNEGPGTPRYGGPSRQEERTEAKRLNPGELPKVPGDLSADGKEIYQGGDPNLPGSWKSSGPRGN